MTNSIRQGYVYSVLRYVHDVIASEFVNVGIALYAPGSKSVRALITASTFRISQVFPGCDGAGLRREFQRIQSDFRRRDQSADSLDEIIGAVLPRDSSALQWSPVCAGISHDLDVALEELFHRYVIRPGSAYDAIETLVVNAQINGARVRERVLISSNDGLYNDIEKVATLRRLR